MWGVDVGFTEWVTPVTDLYRKHQTFRDEMGKTWHAYWWTTPAGNTHYRVDDDKGVRIAEAENADVTFEEWLAPIEAHIHSLASGWTTRP